MRIALQFELPSRRLIVGVVSEDERVLERLLACYTHHLRTIAPPEEEDLSIRISRQGSDYRIETPLMSCRIDACTLEVVCLKHPARGRLPEVAEQRFILPGAADGRDVPAEEVPIHVGWFVENAMLTLLSNMVPGVACFHAAALERNGEAMLLAGPPGVGKTTTALLMVSRGWTSLADDVSMVDLVRGRVGQVKRRLLLRPHESFRADELLDDREESCGSPVRADLRPQYHARAGWYPIADVLFLDRRQDRPELFRLGPVDGTIRVSQHCYFRSGGDREVFAQLSGAFAGARWWECRLGPPIATADLLKRTFDAPSAIRELS